MSISDQDRQMTRLLKEASVQHLRLTIEQIPIGQIVLSADGAVESVDDWTADNIDFGVSTLNGCNVLRLFPCPSGDTITALLRAATPAYVGRTALRTYGGQSISAELALTPAPESHRSVFSIVYFHGLSE